MKFNLHVENLNSYEAGKPIELVTREYEIKPEDVIKLASNENPKGCSLKVVKLIQETANKMSLYPDDSMYELKNTIAKKYEVDSRNIIIGSGSDQIIEFAMHAKANAHSKILTAGVTFAMYEIYGKHAKTTAIKTTSKQHNLKEFLDIYKSKEDISIIFLCLPNNPLGEGVDKDEVFSFLKEIKEDTLVVIDGAYQEFAAYKDINKKIDPKELISKFANTLYLGTFSKVYGLGGMRIGYGIAQEQIISSISKLRQPFNVTTLSLLAAKEALNDKEFLEDTLRENLEQMKRYEDFAIEMSIEYINSYTNFITYVLEEKRNASKIAQEMLKKGIIIRDLKSYGLNAIRITIGTKKQNDRVFDVMRSLGL